MNLLEFPLVKIFFFFLPGIIFAHFCEFDLFIVLGSSLSSVFALLIFLRKRQRVAFAAALYFAAFCTGMAAATLNRATNHRSHYVNFVTGKPQGFNITIREKLKPTPFGTRYVATVNRIDRRKASGKIMVNADLGSDFHSGMTFTLVSKASGHKPPKNPAQFDYAKYLKSKSIFSQIAVSPSAIIEQQPPQRDLYYYSDQLRRRIINNIRASGMDERELHVVSALILGQQQEIAADIMEDYRLAGAVHILSVSGLHVGFIVMIIDLLLKPFPNTRRWRLIKFATTILSLWAFAFLAGLAPSVVRSAAMFSLLTCGNFLRRGANIFHTLIASAILILLIEPMFLFDVGFQLSYAALFFILWLQPELAKLWAPKNVVVRYLWTILTVSIAAQAGTYPLSVFYFHQFPGLFFITNLVIIPFLSIVMILGVAVMILAAMNVLPAILTLILQSCIRIMNGMISGISDLESFVFTDIPMNVAIMLALYCALISAVLCIKRPVYGRLMIMFVCVVGLQVAYLLTVMDAIKKTELIVYHRKLQTVISVNDGRSITIHSTENDPKCATDYAIANFCAIKSKHPVSNLMSFGSKRILIVDTALAQTIPCDILLLRNSPKINLERWLSDSNPTQVIADGSNYMSYVSQWEATCRKRKIPFHNTSEKGFFALKR